MACSTYNYLHLSHKIPSLFISKPSHAFPITFTTPFSSPSHTSTKFNKLVKFSTHSVSVSVSATNTFTWDDVVLISQPDSVPHDSSDLSGFFQKVKFCNRGSVIFFCLCILASVIMFGCYDILIKEKNGKQFSVWVAKRPHKMSQFVAGKAIWVSSICHWGPNCWLYS